MSRLLLAGGRLLDPSVPEPELAEADLYAENGTVLAVGADAQRLASATGEPVERFDAGGKWVLPGFVQAHLHLCQTLLRNGPEGLELLPWLASHVWPGEAALDPETLGVSARLGMAECLASGVTAVLDMGTTRHSDILFRSAARAGIRYTGGNVLMDDPRTTPENLRVSADDGLAETERLRSVWDGRERGRLRVAVSPRFAVSCTEELLRGAADLAGRHGLAIHTHASENLSECALVLERSGRGNLEYLDDVGLLTDGTCVAHAVHTGPEDWERLAARKSAVAHCPTSNLRLASGVCPVPELLAAGVRVALGSDGAPCNDRLDPFREMRMACLLPQTRPGARARVSAKDAVAMATRQGARAIGLQGGDDLSPGGRADFVILDPEAGWASPGGWVAEPWGAIVYSMGPENVFATIVDGVLRFRATDPTVGGLKPAPWEIQKAVTTLRAAISRVPVPPNL